MLATLVDNYLVFNTKMLEESQILLLKEDRSMQDESDQVKQEKNIKIDLKKTHRYSNLQIYGILIYICMDFIDTC